MYQIWTLSDFRMQSYLQLAYQLATRKCMIKVFGEGGRGADTSNLPPLCEQLLLYPPPVLRCFWKDPLMTPNTPLQASFTATPLPIHHPSLPLKILIIHQLARQAYFPNYFILILKTRIARLQGSRAQGSKARGLKARRLEGSKARRLEGSKARRLEGSKAREIAYSIRLGSDGVITFGRY